MGSRGTRAHTADVENLFLWGVYIQWLVLLFKTLKTICYVYYLRSLQAPPSRDVFPMNLQEFEQFRQYQAHKVRFYNVLNFLKCSLITWIYQYRIIPTLWAFSGTVLRDLQTDNIEGKKIVILCMIISTACWLFRVVKRAYITYVLKRAYKFSIESKRSFVKKSLKHWFYITFILLITAFVVVHGYRHLGLFFPFYAWCLALPLIAMLIIMSSYVLPTEKPENEWFVNAANNFARYYYIKLENIQICPFLRKPNRFMFNLSQLVNLGLFHSIKLDYNIMRKNGTICPDCKWKQLHGDHIMALLVHQIGQYYYSHNIKMLIAWMSKMFFLVVSACHFFGYSVILKERPLTVMLFYFLFYVVDPYINIVEPLQMATQFQFLREADKFVAVNEYEADFQEAVVKMFHLEMEEDYETSYYSFLYHPRVMLYEETVTIFNILSCGI